MYNIVMSALSAISGIAVSAEVVPIGDMITVYVGDNDALDEYIDEEFPPVFDEAAFADIVEFLAANTKSIATEISGNYLVNYYHFDGFTVRIFFLLTK